jgi:dimethylaniline monooxygenase (N-oxide forming)
MAVHNNYLIRNNNSTKRCKVAIIGGGASGITTAKCLREDNHEPVVFERSDRIGGVWVYKKTRGGTFDTVHLQNSKYSAAFSDYPMPADFNEFPHHTEVLKYLESYVDRFQIRDCFKLNTIVEKIRRKGSLWEVTTSSEAGRVTQNFDAIAICSGLYHEPKWPKFPGEDSFNGTIIHSCDYKESSIFAGKDVVVVGNGPSGVDIATAASYTAKNVFWSIRKKKWLVPRYDAVGIPIDFTINRLNQLMPQWLLNIIINAQIYPLALEHQKCNLLPDFGVLESIPVFNECILKRVRLGAIAPKPNIAGFQGQRVRFEDGTSIKADIVVYATGYHISLPFFDASTVELNEKNLHFYKNVFHPEIPNCAFVGFVYGNSIFPCAEIQARWFSKVLTGEASLPSKEKMRVEIEADKKKNKNFVESGHHLLRVSAFDYIDNIAREINVRPKFWRHWRIAWHLLTAPLIPAQYRLDGPNRWGGAPEWILKVAKLVQR